MLAAPFVDWSTPVFGDARCRVGLTEAPLHSQASIWGESGAASTQHKLGSHHLVRNIDWTLGPFVREDLANPCLTPDPTATFFCPIRQEAVHWEAKDVFNPAAVVRDGQIHLLYRAEDSVGRFAGTSRIGLATSTDGLHFVRRPTPVLYPDHDAMEVYEWEGGCEDPRIVEDGLGGYVLTYTAYDGYTARLAVATSTDLVHWQKHGLAFGKAQAGRYRDLWSKSGSIVCSLDGDHLVASRIDGKYWMYWGESDIYLATSDNLLDWEPLVVDHWTDLMRSVFGALEPDQGEAALHALQHLSHSSTAFAWAAPPLHCARRSWTGTGCTVARHGAGHPGHIQCRRARS
ncbi:MAG: hypothetical protein IPK16_08825 [Anaerolineales bacterium]|nr:hypothetical protein [Anaerolineales bacterium]